MSIATDVKNILKGINILAPQKDTQETGAPFLAPQPQIFTPLPQTTTPFVPVSSTTAPWQYVPEITKGENAYNAIGGVYNLLPKDENYYTPSSVTPWSKIAKDMFVDTVDYLSPSSIDNQNIELTKNELAYQERLQESQGEWMRSLLADIGDGINSAVSFLPKIIWEAVTGKKLEIPKYKDMVAQKAAQKLNTIIESDEEIWKDYEEDKMKVIGTINNNVSYGILKKTEWKNEFAQQNGRVATIKLSSELINKIMPPAVRILQVAEIERKLWNTEKADAMEASVFNNINAVTNNALELLEMSSDLQDQYGVNTYKAQWDLYTIVNQQWYNINSFMMKGMVDINNKPYDKTYAELGTRYDAFNKQATKIGYDLARDRYYAWDDSAVNNYNFIAWLSYNLIGWITSKATRDLATLAPNLANVVRGDWFSYAEWDYGNFNMSADSLYASDASFLAGMSLSEQDRGIMDQINTYGSKTLDMLPEFGTAMIAAFGLWPVGISRSAITWLKATKWVNTAFTISKEWWIVNQFKSLGLRLMADTMVNTVIDVNTQLPDQEANALGNMFWYMIWDIFEVVSWIKQYNQLENIGSITNYEDISGVIRDTARATKRQELVDKWIDIQDASAQVDKMTDVELIGTKLNYQYIDSRIKEVEDITQIKDKIQSNYTDMIIKQQVLKNQATNPEEIAKIDININKLEQQQQAFQQWWDYSLAMADATRKFLYNPTTEGALEFAQTLKLFLPNTNNPNKVLRSISTLPWDVSSVVRQWLWKIVDGTSMVRYTDGWRKYTQAVDAGFSPTKIYSAESIDEAIKNAEGKDVIKWVGDRTDGWELEYFNKLDGNKYMLNEKWFAKLNLEEKEWYVSLYRNMWNNAAGQEKFLETMKSIDEGSVIKIPEEDLVKIEEWNLYTTLVDEIDEFIPCIL